MSHTYTATAPERNPDVTQNEDKPIPMSMIPPGCYIHEGKKLMFVARGCKPPVPYGLAVKRTYREGTTESRMETVGLIIRETDRERFAAALANKNAKKTKYRAIR